jgi:putative tributyrin esterase
MQFSRLLLLVLSLASASVHAQAPQAGTTVVSGSEIQRRTFFSAALQRAVPYQIVLPTQYSMSQRRYPVLYLLHGWQGDETNWIQLTHLLAVASHYPLIIVLPRAENSWYVNSATIPKDRFGDFLSGDLISEVEQHFRTIASQDGRAIAGLSMGGYGAVLMALRHPGVFSFVGGISSAFDGPSGIEGVMPQLKPSTDAAYGEKDSITRRENNVDLLLARSAPGSVPYLFLECGTADPLLESNRRVVRELQQQGMAYEYHELPGAHTWSFWDQSLPTMLEALANHLHLERQATLPPTVSSQP